VQPFLDGNVLVTYGLTLRHCAPRCMWTFSGWFNAGEQTRASDLRRLARVKEAEIVTLDRLADETVRDRLIAVRARALVGGDRSPKAQRARMGDQVTR